MSYTIARRFLSVTLFVAVLLLLLISMSWSALSQVQPHVPQPYLVADFNVSPTNPSFPAQFATFNGLLYFAATDDADDRELWRSDGTISGTVRVKDLRPTYSSEPSNLTPTSSLLFFLARTADSFAKKLWVSDGTPEGTVMVMDINPGEASGNPAYFAVVGNTLYFSANDGLHDTELWALSHAPLAHDDYVVTRMGQPIGIIFLENDHYLDPDALTIAITAQPQQGAVVLNGSVFLYTPDVGYIGDDSFTYTLTDGVSEPQAATVYISVEGTQLFLPYIVKLNLVD